MRKTYRALAIVAVVATLLSVASPLWFRLAAVYGWFSNVPLGGPYILGIPANLLMALWLPTTTLTAPVVGVFSVIVAAQTRRWGWLVAFILLELLAFYVPSVLIALGSYIDSAVSFRAMGIIESVYAQMFLLALPAIAALIFVASARLRQPVEGIERTTLP